MAELCLPDRLTPCSPADLYATLRKVWPGVNVDSQPSRAALLVLLAHWALETGFGHFCHLWNLGNKKHVPNDGHDYTMFRCNEVIDGKIVWFDPPNPATWFVAFPTLESGAADYLVGLRGRFRTAWPFALAGDVQGFCHALKVAGYYTADEALYTAGVLRCYRQLDAAIPVDGAVGDVVAIDDAANQIVPSERETQPELPDPPDDAA